MVLSHTVCLLQVKIYSDSLGQPKGDALVTYLKPESVDLAVKLLDETFLRDGAQFAAFVFFSAKGHGWVYAQPIPPPKAHTSFSSQCCPFFCIPKTLISQPVMQQLAFDASTIQVQPAQFQQKGDKESAPDFLHCVF